MLWRQDTRSIIPWLPLYQTRRGDQTRQESLTGLKQFSKFLLLLKNRLHLRIHYGDPLNYCLLATTSNKTRQGDQTLSRVFYLTNAGPQSVLLNQKLNFILTHTL